jgi:hypothetical protein
MNPDTRIRQELRLEVVKRNGPAEFLAELAAVLPLAVLFLKKVHTIRYGPSGPALPTVGRDLDTSRDRVLVQNGELRVWQLLRGAFSDDAAWLRSEYPGKIEDKRRSEVILALPLEDKIQDALLDWEGSFFATLPTQESTLLPFHIQADFFPASDRKHLLWEDDYQGEWNRAVVEAAAAVLARNLARLPELLQQPARVCAFLQRLLEVHKRAESKPTRGCLPSLSAFWETAEPVARESALNRHSIPCPTASISASTSPTLRPVPGTRLP